MFVSCQTLAAFFVYSLLFSFTQQPVWLVCHIFTVDSRQASIITTYIHGSHGNVQLLSHVKGTSVSVSCIINLWGVFAECACCVFSAGISGFHGPVRVSLLAEEHLDSCCWEMRAGSLSSQPSAAGRGEPGTLVTSLVCLTLRSATLRLAHPFGSVLRLPVKFQDAQLNVLT